MFETQLKTLESYVALGELYLGLPLQKDTLQKIRGLNNHLRNRYDEFRTVSDFFKDEDEQQQWVINFRRQLTEMGELEGTIGEQFEAIAAEIREGQTATTTLTSQIEKLELSSYNYFVSKGLTPEEAEAAVERYGYPDVHVICRLYDTMRGLLL